MSYTARPYKEKFKLIKDKCLAEKRQAIHSSVRGWEAIKAIYGLSRATCKSVREDTYPRGLKKTREPLLSGKGDLEGYWLWTNHANLPQGHSTKITSFCSVQNLTHHFPSGKLLFRMAFEVTHVPTLHVCSLKVCGSQEGTDWGWHHTSVTGSGSVVHSQAVLEH